MPVRNCAEVGENAQKIINRLLNNQDLIKLLYYNDLYIPYSQCPLLVGHFDYN